MPQLHNYYYYIGSKFGATFISACSLGYHALRKREEGSGNIPILLLCKWNVVNVIFTTLWTATPVASNQNHENHRARANDHICTGAIQSRSRASTAHGGHALDHTVI